MPVRGRFQVKSSARGRVLVVSVFPNILRREGRT